LSGSSSFSEGEKKKEKKGREKERKTRKGRAEKLTSRKEHFGERGGEGRGEEGERAP